MVAAGGLHIVGTERHESRRIDNQLRGRSGRQGDPGSSRFYLSMEDNLMRIFGDPKRTKRLLAMAGMKEGEVIESGMLTRQIEKAQRKVEAHNFDMRKQLLTFDDVANDQRKVIYQQRTELMGANDLADAVRGIRAEVVSTLLDEFLLANVSHEEWNLDALAKSIAKNFATQVDPVQWLKDQPDLEESTLRGRIVGAIDAMYDAKVERIGEPESCGTSRRRSCSTCSTSNGAITWARWTTCARASTCAATRRRIIATSTSARPSSCSRRCSSASSSTPSPSSPRSTCR